MPKLVIVTRWTACSDILTGQDSLRNELNTSKQIKRKCSSFWPWIKVGPETHCLKERITIGNQIDFSEMFQYLFFCFKISKFLHECTFCWKTKRLEEMKEAKKFFHCVLKWGARQQHFVLLWEMYTLHYPLTYCWCKIIFMLETFTGHIAIAHIC